MELELPVTDVLLQFTLVVSAALLVQVTLERSRIPGIVGLLVLGMLIGPGGMGLLPEEPVVKLLGSLGLLYIMFIAGLEIDLDTVRSHKREAVSFGILGFALSFAPAVAVGLLMDLGWTGALLLGAALSSHTLLSYPILERSSLAFSVRWQRLSRADVSLHEGVNPPTGRVRTSIPGESRPAWGAVPAGAYLNAGRSHRDCDSPSTSAW
jgi:hypothetical protein